MLVYIKGQSTDGDWFGGLNAQNAEAFMQSLLTATVRSLSAASAAPRVFVVARWPLESMLLHDLHAHALATPCVVLGSGPLDPQRGRRSALPQQLWLAKCVLSAPAPTLPVQAPSGAAGEAALRPWWRGRVGLSKPEQLQHFEAALRDIEDLR